MRFSRFAKTLVFGFVILALVSTSFGGAFATAAYAATPEEEKQEAVETQDHDKTNKAVIGGLVALGLLAVLNGGKDKDSTGDSPAKNTGTPTQPSQSASPVVVQPAPAPAPAAPMSSGLTADEKRAVELMNADRQAAGLPALKVNTRLVALAEAYAQDMINRNFFSHYNPEGQSPFDRMRQYGISYRYAGENLAINRSVDGAEQAFMNSPGHRANILNPNYTEVGIGVRYDAKGSVYVVQEFIGR